MLDVCIGPHHTNHSQDPSRPLFFIGHSLGGIVIKSVRCVPYIAGQLGAFLALFSSSSLRVGTPFSGRCLAELLRPLVLLLTVIFDQPRAAS